MPYSKPKKTKPKSTIINFTLLTISALLCLGALEIFLRVFYPQCELSKLICEDPVTGWSFCPNTTAAMYTELNYRQKHTVATNSRGCRDFEELDNQKDNIVILGDSLTANTAISNPYLVFTEIMQEQSLTDYNVINLGVTGYSTAQEYLRMMAEGIDMEPKLVVFIFYPGNDFYDNTAILNYFTYRRPYFTLTSNELSLVSPSEIEPFIPGPLYFLTKIRSTNFFIARVLESSKTLLTNNYSLRKFLDQLGWLSNIKPKQWKILHTPPEVLLTNTEDENTTKAYELTCRILNQLDKELKEIDIPLLTVIAPTMVQTRDDYFSELQEKYGLTENDRLLPNRQLLSCAKENDIDIIDLTPEFVAEENQHEKPYLFFARDRHWTEEGNKFVAEILYPQLLERLDDKGVELLSY